MTRLVVVVNDGDVSSLKKDVAPRIPKISPFINSLDHQVKIVQRSTSNLNDLASCHTLASPYQELKLSVCDTVIVSGFFQLYLATAVMGLCCLILSSLGVCFSRRAKEYNDLKSDRTDAERIVWDRNPSEMGRPVELIAGVCSPKAQYGSVATSTQANPSQTADLNAPLLQKNEQSLNNIAI